METVKFIIEPILNNIASVDLPFIQKAKTYNYNKHCGNVN